MSDETTCNRDLGALPRLNVASLTPAEQFVLRACRCWDAFIDDPDSNLPWRELTPVFSFLNVAGALCAFECIFTQLQRQRLRTLRFQDVDVASVGTDEARMLCGLACLRRGQGQASIGVLLGALTPRVSALCCRRWREQRHPRPARPSPAGRGALRRRAASGCSGSPRGGMKLLGRRDAQCNERKQHHADEAVQVPGKHRRGDLNPASGTRQLVDV